MSPPAAPAPPSDDELGRLGQRALRELDDAPEWLIGTAIAMWRSPSPSPAQRIAAALRFDSWAGGPALALRSAGLPSRQLLFAAAGRDIDVRIVPVAPALFEISGQVLGPDERGEIRLELVADGRERQRVALDDLGAFRLGAVPAGRWRLRLQLDAETIELPDLDIGHPAPA